MSTYKLTYEPDYEPPETWEEVKALDRPRKIRAARVFLRRAAVKLCDEAGLLPDDVIMLFDGVTEWVISERHAWKRQQHDITKAMRCTSCTHIAAVKEFWKTGLLACPSCGAADAVQISAGHPSAVSAAVKKVHVAGRVDVPEFQVGVDTGSSQEEPVDGKADFCACDGQSCPVCESMGRKNIIIENHSCIVCETLFCPTCHGIVTTGSSRAFDSCARCKC